jgi:hypothetical protein
MLAGSVKGRRGLVAGGLTLASFLGTAWAQDAAVDEHVRYVVIVEEAKGHLLTSRASYRLRLQQHIRADVHASHPIQELGYHLYRPVTGVDLALGVAQAPRTATRSGAHECAAMRAGSRRGRPIPPPPLQQP